MTVDTEFEGLWKRAVQSYVTTTRRTDHESSMLGNIHSPDDLLMEIERDNGKFSAFREKHAKFRKVLKTTLIPISIVGDISNQAVASSPFAPASVLLGATAFLIKSANGVSQVYDSIEKLFSELASFVHRLEEYVRTDISDLLRQNLILILVYLLQIVGQYCNFEYR